jgi:hypothetical protein
VLTLTEHWDGSAWIRYHGVDPLHDSTDDENVLNGVAVAPGDGHPWAVGYFANFDSGPRAHTLVEQWDGTQWKRVRAPNPGGTALDNQLWDVAAISSTNAWAVGVVNDGGSNSQTLIEHWDGTAWSTIASPHAGALLRIAADRATGNLWAVGYTPAADYQATLIQQACGQ